MNNFTQKSRISELRPTTPLSTSKPRHFGSRRQSKFKKFAIPLICIIAVGFTFSMLGSKSNAAQTENSKSPSASTFDLEPKPQRSEKVALGKCKKDPPRFGGTIAFYCESKTDRATFEYFDDEVSALPTAQNYGLEKSLDNEEIYKRTGIVNGLARAMRLDTDNLTLINIESDITNTQRLLDWLNIQ